VSLPPQTSVLMPQTDKVYRWNREKYSRNRRFVDIWAFMIQFLTGRWLMGKTWSYRGGMTEEKKAQRRRSQSIWIRETFLELGPTFIKVGQLFSTRADLFPSEYVEELSKLQDKVPAFSFEQVESIIEKDFGRTIPELFKSFDPIPLAAASLGQVHKAQLQSGEEVVVKVQRPGLKQLFAIDLDILRGVARYFQSHPGWESTKNAAEFSTKKLIILMKDKMQTRSAATFEDLTGFVLPAFIGDILLLEF
jgi:predicted unusual protein kinase regulating ubiquinone biosynthesis (AarF/ABC1/UbiB family)